MFHVTINLINILIKIVKIVNIIFKSCNYYKLVKKRAKEEGRRN